MSKVIDIKDRLYVIKSCKVQGSRCWGCCQENCRSCSCYCHKDVDGYGIFLGDKCLRNSMDKQNLARIIQEFKDGKRDKNLNFLKEW